MKVKLLKRLRAKLIINLIGDKTMFDAYDQIYNYEIFTRDFKDNWYVQNIKDLVYYSSRHGLVTDKQIKKFQETRQIRNNKKVYRETYCK